MGRWQGCGHVRAALLLTTAGKGEGRAAVARRPSGRFGRRRSVRRKEGRGEMVQGLGQLTGDAGFARPESTEHHQISSDGPK